MGLLQQKVLSQLSQKISRVEEVDLALAKKLIFKHIVPFLKKHHIRPEQFNYTSKYYPKSRNLQSKL
jgi:hypothetical protein